MDQNRTSDESSKGEPEATEPRAGVSDNPAARDDWRLGNLYFQSMVYEYAADAYKRAVQADPNYATAHYGLGAAYYKMGLFAEAREELETAIKLASDVPRFHFTLGLVLKDDKNTLEAIASFSKAIELDDGYVIAYYRRGHAYSYIDDLKRASSDLRRVIELDPEFHDALHDLGKVYISLRRWRAAQEVFLECLALEPNDSDAFYYMGMIRIGRGEEPERAMEDFQKAVELDPGHLEARFQLSLLHARKRYREPSHRQEAIRHLRALIEMYEELGDFQRIHDAYFLLGSLYDDDTENAELAIEAYKSGLQLAGGSAEAHNNLGVLYSQKGAVDEAVREFREAIRLDPEYESPYHNLAKVYFYQRNEEIVKDFQQWIEELPDMSASILFNLSLALMDVGRSEAYESIYSRAHRIKNLIGVAGSKLRRICREVDNDMGEQLTSILADQEKCYNEMESLLGTLKQDDLLLDMVDVNASIEAVLRQADFKCDDQSGYGTLCLGDEDLSYVECIIDLAQDLPRVKGDPRKLKEAFNNMIINALQAMKHGDSLRISTRYSETTSGVEISLQDTGAGISTEDIDNIFKPGYTTKGSGSGFGLSIVDRIIKEHKGSIHISSREGEGTEVKIYLPVNLEASPIHTSLRMRPVFYEDPSELIFTEVDQIVDI